jgi:hypothetical protein
MLRYRWNGARPQQRSSGRAAQQRALVACRASPFTWPFSASPAKQDVKELLQLVAGTDRGVKSDTARTKQILSLVDRLATSSSSSTTTASQLSSTWKLLWTTEKV